MREETANEAPVEKTIVSIVIAKISLLNCYYAMFLMYCKSVTVIVLVEVLKLF